MSSTTNLARGVALCCVSCGLIALLCVTAELLARHHRPDLIPEHVFLTGTDHLKPDSNSAVFQFDPRLIWRLKPNLRDIWWDYTLISTNLEGFRMEKELSPKPTGVLRIVCLGDSITFGYRIPTAFPDELSNRNQTEKSYCLQIADLLSLKQIAAESIPLAVPGYTSYQGRLLAEQKLHELKPDIVLINYGYNDVTLAPRPYSALFSSDTVSYLLRTLATKSHVVLLLFRALNKKTLRDIELTRTVSRGEQLENILTIASLANSVGARTLVIGQLYQRHDGRVSEEIAADRGALEIGLNNQQIEYLEIPELTEKGWPENRYLFGEAIHPSILGHTLLAQRIVEKMNQLNWL